MLREHEAGTLTSAASNKLNRGFALRRSAVALGSTKSDAAGLPQSPRVDERALSDRHLFQETVSPMKPNGRYSPERSAYPAGAEFWHLWSVSIPRRSIKGGLVWGRVWRRHNGDRWLYASIHTPKRLLRI